MKDPVRYSRKLFKDICDQLAAGKSLRAVCRAEGYPSPSNVIAWVLADKDDCAEQYARAREIQAMLLLDEIQAISDDSSGDELILDNGARVLNKEFAARSKLRVDTRKWAMSKMLPKVYGDRLDLNHAGKVEVALTGASLLLARAKLEAEESPADEEAAEDQKPTDLG